MKKRVIYLVLSVFFVLFLIGSIIASPKLAYIHRSNGKIDMNVVNIFNESGLLVDYFIENEIPDDLSMYRFLFIGDEFFNSRLPLNEHSVIIFSKNQAEKAGLVPLGDAGKLGSREPLKVNINGSEVKVYTQAKDNNGVSIPYYYLNTVNIPKGVLKLAGTYTTSSGVDFGYVVAIVNEGVDLLNSEKSGGDICFFGITKTEYWTNEARELFKNCVNFVNKPLASEINCSLDLDCGVSEPISEPISEPVCNENDLTQNYIQYTCNNPGTVDSYCSSETVEEISSCDLCDEGSCIDLICVNDNECDDNDDSTIDECYNPGSLDCKCVYTLKELVFVSVITSSTTNSVKLDIFAEVDNETIVGKYEVKKGDGGWLEIVNNSYVFEGLNSGVEYDFYIKVINDLGVIIGETNVSVSTLIPVPEPTPLVIVSSGGGGGGFISIYGSMSWCSLDWECSSWSKCIDGSQTRVCDMPEDKCKPENKKPDEERICVPELELEPLSAPIATMEYENNGKEFDEVVPEVLNIEVGVETRGERDGNLITGASIAANVGKFSWVWIPILIVGIFLAYYYLSGGRIRKIKKK
ncbi:fibronectin type III domain-containing protein [Candidatus Pacearchaeota archaeon]|nr:fibronectin type III domain-containing protein [Candidatus Pacearchaeota archaeon]